MSRSIEVGEVRRHQDDSLFIVLGAQDSDGFMPVYDLRALKVEALHIDDLYACTHIVLYVEEVVPALRDGGELAAERERQVAV